MCPQPCNHKEGNTYIESCMLIKLLPTFLALELLGPRVEVEMRRQHALKLKRFATKFTNMGAIVGVTTASVGTQVVAT